MQATATPKMDGEAPETVETLTRFAHKGKEDTIPSTILARSTSFESDWLGQALAPPGTVDP